MASRHDTVAIASLDGFAKAKTTFSARRIPSVGNAATLLDSEGQVVDGAIYFVDASGMVRRMVKRVAQFPISSAQQSISFAVSPDGSEVIAAVLTYPVNVPQTDPSQPPWGTFTGPWRLQIEKVTASGSASILHQWQSNTTQYPNASGGFQNIWLAGWDSQGPIALVGQNTGTQNAWLSNQRYFGGQFARLNSNGTPGAPIGPAGCLPYWRPVLGRFVCTGTNPGALGAVDVVGLDGRISWSGNAPATQNGNTGDFVISPDASRLAMDGEVVTLASNAVARINPNFQPQGWLDNGTLIGWLPQNGPTAPHMAILHLSAPQDPEDWGFSGSFVGLLPA
jgi:hypothetical protein